MLKFFDKLPLIHAVEIELNEGVENLSLTDDFNNDISGFTDNPTLYFRIGKGRLNRKK